GRGSGRSSGRRRARVWEVQRDRRSPTWSLPYVVSACRGATLPIPARAGPDRAGAEACRVRSCHLGTTCCAGTRVPAAPAAGPPGTCRVGTVCSVARGLLPRWWAPPAAELVGGALRLSVPWAIRLAHSWIAAHGIIPPRDRRRPGPRLLVDLATNRDQIDEQSHLGAGARRGSALGVAGDELLHPRPGGAVVVLLRRGLHEVARGGQHRSAQAAVLGDLRRAQGIDDDPGGVRRVPHLELVLQVQRHLPYRRALQPYVRPLPVVQPGHVVRGPDVHVPVLLLPGQRPGEVGGDRLGLRDLLRLQPLPLEHVLEVHVAAAVQLVGPVQGHP